jgi:hypothetical protein
MGVLAEFTRTRSAFADCPWYNPTCYIDDVESVFDDVVSTTVDVAVCVSGGCLDDLVGFAYDGAVYVAEVAEDGRDYVLRGPGGSFASTGAVLAFLGVPLDPGTLILVSETINQVSKWREMSSSEEWAAREVFGGTLPPRGQILLTNIPHIQEAWGDPPRQFVWYNFAAGKYVVNLGGMYSNPLSDENKPILMHELTHVWQIAHSSSFASWACNVLTNRSYSIDKEKDWSDNTPEGQGVIVETWSRYCLDNRGGYDDLCDQLHPYIERNVRRGDPAASKD